MRARGAAGAAGAGRLRAARRDRAAGAEAPASAAAQPGVAGARTLVVEPPLAAAALRTLRIPVVTSDTSLAWLKDAQWLEAPARQFQGLLLAALGAQPGIAAVDARLHDGAGARRLGGSLDALGVDARTPGRQLATVRFTAVLSGARGTLLGTAAFEASRPVDASDPDSVVRGLSAAAREAAEAAARWAAAQGPT
jgi:cholesterol transport system auxiliary component